MFYFGRLVASLAKYWRPVSTDEVKMMTTAEINDAVAVAGFPKEVVDWIWEKQRDPFEVY